MWKGIVTQRVAFLGWLTTKLKQLNSTRWTVQFTQNPIVHQQPSQTEIKAIGGAEGTGRLVGSSIGASAAPSLANIPYVGWVAAGWVTMFGGNQGADIGGQMAEDLSKDC